MTEQSCDTCTHWADLGNDIGQCRRHAPRPRAGTDEVRWPATEADDWCGDWESVECDCDDNEVCGICGPDPVDIEFDHIVGSLFTTKPRRWWQVNIKRRTN